MTIKEYITENCKIPEHEVVGYCPVKFGFEDDCEDGSGDCKKCWDKEYVKDSKDLIHHPAHYCYSDYEPKDVIRAWGLNFNLGSAVKYIARAGRKDDIIQELKKAKQFIEFEIEAIEKERGKQSDTSCKK